jgi:hypothetical protein
MQITVAPMPDANFYVVYIDRLPDVEYDSVKEKMNLSRSWYRITERLWVLNTTSNSEKWFARLSPFVKDTGSLLICKLDMSDNQGWMNEKFWAWVRKQSGV